MNTPTIEDPNVLCCKTAAEGTTQRSCAVVPHHSQSSGSTFPQSPCLNFIQAETDAWKTLETGAILGIGPWEFLTSK